jgi:hypothetical protein
MTSEARRVLRAMQQRDAVQKLVGGGVVGVVLVGGGVAAYNAFWG